MGKENTKFCIMDKALELFSKKGYDGVSTKEIAKESGVSEMTLFRHFGSKFKLLESALNTSKTIDELEENCFSKITYDLYDDLTFLYKFYQKGLDKEKNHLKAVIKLNDTVENFKPLMLKKPMRIKKRLVKYFDEMIDRGNISEDDADKLAGEFMFMCMSSFMVRNILNIRVDEIFKQDVGEELIKKFIKSIEPENKEG